jgi:hypothetical protein
MTPEQLANCLAVLCWTNTDLANAIGRDEAVVRRYLAGTKEIPPPVAAWLVKAASWMLDNPCPKLPAHSKEHADVS